MLGVRQTVPSAVKALCHIAVNVVNCVNARCLVICRIEDVDPADTATPTCRPLGRRSDRLRCQRRPPSSCSNMMSAVSVQSSSISRDAMMCGCEPRRRVRRQNSSSIKACAQS